MATLQYDFRVVGFNSVMAAFHSLEQRALQHNQTVSRAFGGSAGVGGGARAGSGGRGAQHDAHVKAHARERERALRQQVTDQQRANAALERARQQEIRNQDRHAVRQINIARRMENERKRERDRAQRQAENAAFREQRRIARSRYEAGVGALTSLGSRAAGLLALGGGAALAAGVTTELRLGKSSAALAGLAKQGGDTRSLKVLQAGITEQVRTVGKATGMSREDVVAGMTAFLGKAGELDAGKELAPFFADMAQITQSSMEDIGDMAGMAYFQAITKGMSKKEARAATEEIVRSFAAQAAAGTIEMKDYAKVAPKLLSAAGLYEGDFAKNAAAISAIAQTTPGGGATSAAEAATSLARLGDAFREKRRNFRELGVDTFTISKKTGLEVLRDPLEIIRDVLKATGGNLGMLDKFDLNIRAERAVMGMHQKFAEAGGGEAGLRAVDQHVNRFMKARVDPQMQSEIAAHYRAQPAVQFEAAFNELKDEVGKSLLPALTKLAPSMSKLVVAMDPLIRAVGRFAENLVNHPWSTLASALTLAITGSIAKAALGEAVKAQIMKMLLASTATPGVPLPGTPTPVPGVPVPTGGLSSFLPTLLKGLGYFALVQMESDAASKTADQVMDEQDIATENAIKSLKEKGTLPLEYAQPYENFPLLKKRVSKELSMQELGGLEGAGVLTVHDFIRNFGKEGAEKLGLITASGELGSTKDIGNKAIAEQNQKAVESFQKAVSEFAQAATMIGGNSLGNIVGGIFGLNRGDGPATPSSGGSR